MTIPDQRPGASGPPMRPLSPSRAADFKSCPLKYRYRAIDRIPEPPSAAAARGTLVHSVLEHLFERPAAERTEEAATSSVPNMWAQLLERRPELSDLAEAADLGAWFTAARSLVRRYFTLEDPRRFEPDAREMRVEVTISDDVPTRGFIDRLDVSPSGLVRIVDYKTGKAPPAAYTDDALFQLKFYALMWYRLRGVVVARLRIIYLGNGELVEFTPDEPGLLAFEKNIVQLWQAIAEATRTGNFPPRRSKLCEWCSFRQICPEFGGTPPPYPRPAVP